MGNGICFLTNNAKETRQKSCTSWVSNAIVYHCSFLLKILPINVKSALRKINNLNKRMGYASLRITPWGKIIKKNVHRLDKIKR